MKSEELAPLAPMSSIKLKKKCFEKIKADIDAYAIDDSNNIGNDDLVGNHSLLKSLISYCISESEDIESIHNNFEELRREKDGYKLQAKRLIEENKWLREELRLTQDKLQSKELEYVEIEESNKSLKFLVELQDNSSNDVNDSKSTKPLDLLINGTGRSQLPLPQHSLPSALPVGGFGSTGMSTSMTASSSSGMQVGGQHHLLPVHEVPPRLKTLHQLVIQYASQGRYEIAIPLCKQTLADLEMSSGRLHPDVATMLNILALVYRDKGDFEDAVDSLTQALEIRKKTLGDDSPKVAATLNNLSVLYAKQGNHAQAEPLCRDALKIREHILGPHHPDVARQLNNLALLCHNQGKYDEVERFYKRALAIYLKTYSSSDPNVIKTKNNLASSCIKQNKLREAESLLKEVLNEAQERQWLGRERDGKSKTIWVIAEERESMKSLSVSMDTLTVSPSAGSGTAAVTSATGDGSHSNGDAEHPPPYGYDLKHRNKDDKIALLTTLKLLSSLFRRENKLIAADIIDEWLGWAGKSLNKFHSDVRWLSYESSLLQSDIYQDKDQQKQKPAHYHSQTLWYPTPSPVNIVVNQNPPRPSSSIPTVSGTRYSSRIPVNTEFVSLATTNAPDTPADTTPMNPYLYSPNRNNSKSKYESEKSNVYDNIDKS